MRLGWPGSDVALKQCGLVRAGIVSWGSCEQVLSVLIVDTIAF